MTLVTVHQLHVLHQKLQPVNRKGITKKHPSGKPHQISNAEGWGRNVQFGGSVLLPRYNISFKTCVIFLKNPVKIHNQYLIQTPTFFN
ncbi:MAG: hypothetical protein DRI97_10705 [Bacteroidetes bacterium]|nr:MAG: hypothetical protein DRI97_10705 [Bacteroidota bacterium]